MKAIMSLLIFSCFFVVSCSTVQVKSDYDTKAEFTKYKSFAFYKTGIDKVEINDLDKKRILRAVDRSLADKGLVKSETPDLLVNFTTKAEKSVQVSQQNFGYGFGWGWWNPFWFGNNFVNTYETIDGILVIDLIDAEKNELIWQGIGKAPLVDGPEAKTERINEIVAAILAKYPPENLK